MLNPFSGHSFCRIVLAALGVVDGERIYSGQLKKAFNIHMLNCLNGAYAIFWSLILRVLPVLLVLKIEVIGYPFDG